MYKRNSLKSHRLDIPKIEPHEYECDHSFHDLHYYLHGGSDPTGEHLDMSRVTMSDAAEDIASGCCVDARCDPRTNIFDIMEQSGVKATSAMVDATKAGETAVE